MISGGFGVIDMESPLSLLLSPFSLREEGSG
jgi:hypothetical protein